MKKLLHQATATLILTAMVVTLPWPSGAVVTAQEKQPTANLLKSEPITAGAKLEKWSWETATGKSKVNVIEVDLTHPYIQVDAIGGKNGKLGDKQSITNMANERGAAAAVNGDYFTMTAEGAPFGVHIQSGEVISSPGYIASKYAFALDQEKQPYIGLLDFNAQFIAQDGATFQIFGVNKTQYQAKDRYNGNSHINRLHMYTDKWNMKNWVGNSLKDNYTVALVEGGEVTRILQNAAVETIPQGAYLLLGHGEAETFLKEHVRVGDDVEYTFEMTPGEELSTAIHGTSLLVRDGKMINHTDKEKNSRTAVGYSEDNKWMYMVTVEKGKDSIGMTFAELGLFLEKRGAWYAVNLDGGGSTTMATRGLGDFKTSLAMQPKEGSQRSVPNGLGIFSTAPKGSLEGWSIYVPQRVLVNETGTVGLKGYDEYFNPMNPNEIPVEWKGSIAVKDDRSFVLEKPGTYGKDDIKNLVINQDKIQLHPGGTAQATASFTFTDGSTRNVSGSLVTWQLLGAKGSVQQDGTVTAEQSSVGMLIASYQGYSTAVPVIIGTSEYRLIDDFQTPGHYVTTGHTKLEQSSFSVTEESGIKVGTFTYDFGPSEDIRIAYLNYGTQGKSVSGEPAMVSLKVKGDNSGHWLRAEFSDAKGNVHRVNLAEKIDWEGWKTLEVPLPQMAYPATLKSIYVVHLENDKDTTRNNGELSFAELKVKDWMKLEQPTKPSLVFTLNKKEVLVNQKGIVLDQAPVIKDGRTLLPLRSLSELIGGYVEWNPDERKVEVRENYRIHDLWLDSSYMSVNGKRKELDVKPIIQNGRVLLPLRAFAEAYGLYIEYDAKTQKIKVY